MRKHQLESICFPSYAFSVERADGDPIAEIKSPCGDRMKKLTTDAQNRLTSKIIAPTMQTLTGTYVLVDKK
jgi:hypothetical protein